MNIAICDDDALHLNFLKTQCQTFSCIEKIYTYSDVTIFLSDCSGKISVDAVFMDIDFKEEKNGIDYSTELFRINSKIRIIYVTGFTDRYVQHIFLQRSNLIGFLTKPVQKDLLTAIIEKLQKEIDTDKQMLFCTYGKGNSVSLFANTILFIESEAHRCYIYTENGEKHCVYEQLTELAKRLPAGFAFCHKSFLVNMEKINRMDKDKLYLNHTDRILTISKSRSVSFRSTYFHYMQNK